MLNVDELVYDMHAVVGDRARRIRRLRRLTAEPAEQEEPANVAMVVSVTAETPQVFSTHRNPSAPDVAYAVAGAPAGGAVRFLREPRESRRT